MVVDLVAVRDTLGVGDLAGEPPSGDVVSADLPWPEDGWVERCAASPLVGVGRPIRQQGSQLWLARYWEQEEQVANELLARSSSRPDDLDLDLLRRSLDRLFGGGGQVDVDQRTGAAVCVLARVSVLAGGPGTGKTTTVSRLLAALRDQDPTCRIALAAPTGKAAARLEEAVRSSTTELSAADRERLGQLPAVTLHRLLGWRPGRAAASGTTEPTGCPTRWSWLTKAQWCR